MFAFAWAVEVVNLLLAVPVSVVREQYTQRMIAARQRQFPIGVHVWFLVGDKKRHGVVVGYGGDYWWLCDVVKVKNTATGTIREEKAYALELCEHCQING